ncbi:MAG: hypothetical protein JWN49_727 [Parcubacteria group bacterium]|nr:hypothetical protein [Parcubacteria group bacterium]
MKKHPRGVLVFLGVEALGNEMPLRLETDHVHTTASAKFDSMHPLISWEDFVAFDLYFCTVASHEPC